MSIRADFPILSTQSRGKPLVYLDSAATTQKPRAVLDAMQTYYETSNANVHRAAYELAERATQQMEEARTAVAAFVNAPDRSEVIFTRGTTESINLVAYGLTDRLTAEDNVVVTTLEHHSNLVPWQIACQRTGATLRAAAVTEDGDVDLEHFASLVDENTRLVSFGHVSNALGTVNPVKTMTQTVRARSDAWVCVDGAQAALHLPLDVVDLDVDFYAFSSHKMYGPTGMGVLWGRTALLDALPPYQSGGEMIEHVTLEGATYNVLPYKFEAGTPNIAGAIGLGAAVSYLGSIDRAALVNAEAELVQATLEGLTAMNGVRIVGRPSQRSAVVSFLLEDGHPADVGTLLDQQGISVRTGHHCAMPLMQSLGIPGTVRASFSLYNDSEDVDRLLAGVRKALSFL